MKRADHRRLAGRWLWDWRGEPTGRWIIVSAGASLYGIDPEHVIHAGARVVAVNRAFAWLEGRCEYWMMGERPEGIWNALGRDAIKHWLTRGATVLAPEKYTVGWEHEYAEATVEAYDLPRPGWETEQTWQGGTAVQAIAWCCSQGAREIHVVGADMHGRGGWGYEYRHREDDRWRERWDAERGSFERACAEAREHGVYVERVVPGVPVLAAGGAGAGSAGGGGARDAAAVAGG